MEARLRFREARHLRCPGCNLVLMNRTGVKSSNIVAVGWERDEDAQDGILEVEFKGGIVYQYDAVPEWIYQGLLFAESPGRYLLTSIAPAYNGQRIE